MIAYTVTHGPDGQVSSVQVTFTPKGPGPALVVNVTEDHGTRIDALTGGSGVYPEIVIRATRPASLIVSAE